MAQIEIKNLVPILDESGKPANFGWASVPCFQYNADYIRVSRRRVHEADRYIIFSPTHLAIFEIVDSGYLGYTSISVISLKDKTWSLQTHISPFPLGSFEMPSSSEKGSIKIHWKKSFLEFIVMKGGARIIKTDVPQFSHHRSLRGELVLTKPQGGQPIVTHTPWRREKSAFHYALCSPWYTVEGVIQLGTAEIIFTKGNGWGIFAWSRGVRPRSNVHYWAVACGLSGGKLAGFNVGYGSSDSGIGTENAFFLEGKLHKLDQVTFHISPSNWLLPWRFTSNDRRLEMVFTPYQEQAERSRMIFHIIKRRQVYGFFSGTVLLDNGSVFEFQQLTGFAEWQKIQF